MFTFYKYTNSILYMALFLYVHSYIINTNMNDWQGKCQYLKEDAAPWGWISLLV
jgi:hypothetical protein